MTQKIFDTNNKEDMALLWSILPDDVVRIKPAIGVSNRIEFEDEGFNTILFAIIWHDKTEITRPMPEATEQDIGKLCIFWNDNNNLNLPVYKVLYGIKDGKYETFSSPLVSHFYDHARRLTKQEIEELC